MSLVKVASALLLTSVAVFASDAGHGGGTDILPRAVNFLIFAALAYYLLADKLKSFFGGRAASIAKAYEDAENKIKEAKVALDVARAKKEEVAKLANELIASSKTDAVVQAKKIAEHADEEIVRVKKSAEDEMSMMRKKAIIDTVEEAIGEVVDKEGFGVDDKDFAKIIAKRVA
jgi:F-type H+-transporting ATPase subunit b